MLHCDIRKTGVERRFQEGMFNANFASESDFMLGFDGFGQFRIFPTHGHPTLYIFH